jgi:hypothetical protein
MAHLRSPVRPETGFAFSSKSAKDWRPGSFEAPGDIASAPGKRDHSPIKESIMTELSKILMLRMTSIAKLRTLAMFACLVGSPDALAQQVMDTPLVGTNAPQVQRAPALTIKPIQQPNQIPKQARPVPAPGSVNPDGGTSQPLLQSDRPQTDRPNFSGVRHAPSGAVQPARPRAAHREVARRVTVAGGVLVLPVVAYFGVPVILDVPGVGYVEVAEEEYARLYEQLSSSDLKQVDAAIASLRAIKAAEDAEVEAARNRPRDTSSSDVPGVYERDLSEPVSFDGPLRINARRSGEPSRRLY